MAKKDNSKLLLIGLAGAAVLYAISKTPPDDKETADGTEPYGGKSPSGLPRGLANKNPLNLALSNNPWKGKVPNEENTDFGKPRLEQFTTYKDGIRANILNINAYLKSGSMMLKEFIAQWGTGDKTKWKTNASVQNYIKHVVDSYKRAGITFNGSPVTADTRIYYLPQSVAAADKIKYATQVWALYRGMAEFENGLKYASFIEQLKPTYAYAMKDVFSYYGV